MISVTNCHNEYEFTSIAEACRYLGFKVNTIYAKRLPFNYGGFFWERKEVTSNRHVVCTRCGLLKWDTEYYKASKQPENHKKPHRVNQPCKKCQKEVRTQNKTQYYDPKRNPYY
jgi:hypothetical protein